MSQRRPQFILLSNMYVWTCAYQTLYLILQLMERVVNQHWLPLPIRSDTMRLLSCAMKNQVARGKRFIPYPVKRKALYWYSNRDFFSPSYSPQKGILWHRETLKTLYKTYNPYNALHVKSEQRRYKLEKLSWAMQFIPSKGLPFLAETSTQLLV